MASDIFIRQIKRIFSLRVPFFYCKKFPKLLIYIYNSFFLSILRPDIIWRFRFRATHSQRTGRDIFRVRYHHGRAGNQKARHRAGSCSCRKRVSFQPSAGVRRRKRHVPGGGSQLRRSGIWSAVFHFESGGGQGAEIASPSSPLQGDPSALASILSNCIRCNVRGGSRCAII